MSPTYVDPAADSEDVPFWRINEQVGNIVVLEPLSEHTTETQYGKDTNVIDCFGGVWTGTEFSPIGNVTVFQEVLQKKLRPALTGGATVVAKLVKPGVAYDLRPVDGETRAKVTAAWDTATQEVEQPKLDDTF